MHAIPLRYKLGVIKRCIEEDNKGIDLVVIEGESIREISFVMTGTLHFTYGFWLNFFPPAIMISA